MRQLFDGRRWGRARVGLVVLIAQCPSGEFGYVAAAAAACPRLWRTQKLLICFFWKGSRVTCCPTRITTWTYGSKKVAGLRAVVVVVVFTYLLDASINIKENRANINAWLLCSSPSKNNMAKGT